ncbi:polysaccharide biosynthesis protein [bacterium]|nr:polysaccharide biosynthesis protein [bacterium]
MKLVKKLPEHKKAKTIIVGAGVGGRMIVKEIQAHPELGYEIVGFIDDDQKKLRRRFHGVEVIGTVFDIPNVVNKLGVEAAIICIPSASGEINRNIVARCEESGVDYRIIPGVFEILGGTVDVSPIRNVDVEDLLRRPPVTINSRGILEYLSNKVVLITGAGGSIGSELCRQICKIKPRQMLLLGHGENSIYQINRELRTSYPHIEIEPIICSVVDTVKLNYVMKRYQPNVVFHAAAYKHVPLMQDFPEECVKNNIIGTLNVVMAADRYEVKKFVSISTDKAVNCVNNMGISKRIAEMVIRAFSKISRTEFMIVRFGNVLGSRGSVVPLFKEQIAKGGPVTVTHPEMTRFFMTMPEAAQLVVQAGSLGKGGDVFVLDMGEPVKMLDMAEDLIRLSGFEPYVDIPIEFIGIRPGEKLYEELLTTQEGTVATKHERIFQTKAEDVNKEALMKDIEELRKLAIGVKREEIVKKFWEILSTHQAHSKG